MIVALLFAQMLGHSVAYAGTPCGSLAQFEGEVSLIAENPSDFLATRLKAAIPCGAWVSVRTGWADVHLKHGAKFRLGVDTFVQIGSENANASLFRGRVFVQIEPGAAPVKIWTANAAATLAKGSAILFYDGDEQRTQLIGVEAPATLANRYHDGPSIQVKPGEGTLLDFRNARVVPSTPNPLDLAMLKKMVLDLSLDGRQAEGVLFAAAERSDRRLASEISGHSTSRKKTKRNPASSYARFEPMPGDGRASALWMRHLVAGDRDVREFLAPQEYRGPAGRAVVVVEDVNKVDASAEKKKLIEELKKIQGGR